MSKIWRSALGLFLCMAWATAHAGFLEGLFGGRGESSSYGGSFRPVPSAPVAPNQPVLTIQPTVTDYRLGPGDKVSITVFNEKELSMDVRLGDAGSFLYPFLGEVVAKGITISSLQELLTKSLADGYIVDPKVYVGIVEYRPFFVNGEVTKPGGYPYQPGLTVRKAISLAGGLTPRASLSKIYVIHEDDPLAMPVLTTLNSILLPGDIVTVDQSFF